MGRWPYLTGEVKCSEVKPLAQSHTASGWQSQDLDPDPNLREEGWGPGLLGLREEGLGGWAPGPELKALALHRRSGLGPGGSRGLPSLQTWEDTS